MHKRSGFHIHSLSLSPLIPMQFHLSLLHVSSHYSLAVSALSLSLSKILSLSSLIFRELHASLGAFNSLSQHSTFRSLSLSKLQTTDQYSQFHSLSLSSFSLLLEFSRLEKKNGLYNLGDTLHSNSFGV